MIKFYGEWLCEEKSDVMNMHLTSIPVGMNNHIRIKDGMPLLHLWRLGMDKYTITPNHLSSPKFQNELLRLIERIDLPVGVSP